MTFDLVSAILLVSGTIRLIAEMMNGDKDRRGWLVMIVASLVSLAWCWATGAVALAIISILTVFVALRGWSNWGRIADERRLTIHRLNDRLAGAEARAANLEAELNEARDRLAQGLR